MRKQPNSSMCFVCGLDNPLGLHLAFYEDGDGTVICELTPPAEYQGYPDRVHGGIVTALLDEVLGRAAIARDVWASTAKLEVRYRQPVPLQQPTTVRGRLTRLRGRVVEACGEVLLADGSLAAEARAVLVRISEDERALVEEILPLWQVVPDQE